MINDAICIIGWLIRDRPLDTLALLVVSLGVMAAAWVVLRISYYLVNKEKGPHPFLCALAIIVAILISFFLWPWRALALVDAHGFTVTMRPIPMSTYRAAYAESADDDRKAARMVLRLAGVQETRAYLDLATASLQAEPSIRYILEDPQLGNKHQDYRSLKDKEEKELRKLCEKLLLKSLNDRFGDACSLRKDLQPQNILVWSLIVTVVLCLAGMMRAYKRIKVTSCSEGARPSTTIQELCEELRAQASETHAHQNSTRQTRQR